MNQQVLTFMMSCVLGGALAFLYDIFRIARIAIKTCKVIVFIEDVLFFAISALCSFIFIMSENRGEIRGLLIIGEIVGGILYFYTISVVLINCANLIINTVKSTVKLFYSIFAMPIIRLIAWLNHKIKTQINISKLVKLINIIDINE